MSDAFIRSLASRDASADELLQRFEGARSAFMRRGTIDESCWDVYREQYELSLTGLCDGERARQRRQMGGGR